MPSLAGKTTLGTKSSLWLAIFTLCASIVAWAPTGSAKATELSTVDSSGMTLPDGISVTLIADDSKAPNPALEGSKPYSCLGIYLVSSLSVPTVVHVSGLTLSEEPGGDSILYGGTLNGYLTVPANTLDSSFLASSQALGRLSPGGTFSDPLHPKATAAGAIPDVYNCQSADIGRMFGLTITGKVNYLVNHDLYLGGSVDPAITSTYDVAGINVPSGFTATTRYRNSEGYAASCITRDGRSTTFAVALKKVGVAATYAQPGGNLIARNVIVDGVEYPSPGIPNVRKPCIPVAVIPNDDLGDITGDRQMYITADIVKWSGKIYDKTKLVGTSLMSNLKLGVADVDGTSVTYDPAVNKSFVWYTAQSIGTRPKCLNTGYSFSKVTATYTTRDGATNGSLLVRSTSARRYPKINLSPAGVNSYAILSLPGNVFLADGTIRVFGDVTATDKCTR